MWAYPRALPLPRASATGWAAIPPFCAPALRAALLALAVGGGVDRHDDTGLLRRCQVGPRRIEVPGSGEIRRLDQLEVRLDEGLRIRLLAVHPHLGGMAGLPVLRFCGVGRHVDL